MKKELLLVDMEDNVIGYGQKDNVHRKGLLHRAFSLFIYDKRKQKILLQKRSVEKYHSGGLWSNSCCSHPYKGEGFIDALERCMLDELGIEKKLDDILFVEDADCYAEDMHEEVLIQVGTFAYYTNYGQMKEHEIDHVFLYIMNDSRECNICPNRDEVSKICWCSIEEIDDVLKDTPNIFTSWFKNAFELVKDELMNLN